MWPDAMLRTREEKSRCSHLFALSSCDTLLWLAAQTPNVIPALATTAKELVNLSPAKLYPFFSSFSLLLSSAISVSIYLSSSMSKRFPFPLFTLFPILSLSLSRCFFSSNSYHIPMSRLGQSIAKVAMLLCCFFQLFFMHRATLSLP